MCHSLVQYSEAKGLTKDDLDKSGLAFNSNKPKKDEKDAEWLQEDPSIDPIYSIKALHDTKFVKSYKLKWGTNPDHLAPTIKQK